MPHREAYLDNAATMRPYASVVDAVTAAMRDGFGNASAAHARGRRAKELLEECRGVVADALGVEACEVYFTSGGTESNNLAIIGAARSVRNEHPDRDHLVASTIEHPSVTKTVRGLKREGWRVSYLSAKGGEVSDADIASELEFRTSVISCMHVNNETGYILPVARVVEARDELAPQAYVHTDGVQSFGKVRFRPHELGVDMASICAHKIGGPQGVGALYVKRHIPRIFTTAFGGGQERGLRSGTEALPLIAGFAEAVRVTMARRAECEERVRGLRDELLDGVRAMAPDMRVNSREDGSAFIANFSIPGMDNDAALHALSDAGVYVSKASACATLFPDIPPEDWRDKHPQVLLQCGVPEELLESTLRVSLSQESALEDVHQFLEALADFLA